MSAWTVMRWESGASLPLLTQLPGLVTSYVCDDADLFAEIES